MIDSIPRSVSVATCDQFKYIYFKPIIYICTNYYCAYYIFFINVFHSDSQPSFIIGAEDSETREDLSK